jgi:hypothetical protein
MPAKTTSTRRHANPNAGTATVRKPAKAAATSVETQPISVGLGMDSEGVRQDYQRHLALWRWPCATA